MAPTVLPPFSSARSAPDAIFQSHRRLCQAYSPVGMITKVIEATNGDQNWGKFLVGRFTPKEWNRRSAIDPPRSLLQARGWPPKHNLVLDLQTREGAISAPGGHAGCDLKKHQIWVLSNL